MTHTHRLSSLLTLTTDSTLLATIGSILFQLLNRKTETERALYNFSTLNQCK